jgi:transcriptional regulator with XRE-family HTH domain
MVSPQQVGARIKARRLQQKLSQADLAKLIGVSFQQIQKYETGANAMNIQMAQAIAAALDAPISYFLADSKTARQPELELLAMPGAFVLLSAFAKIKDRKARQCLLDTAELFASR